jgi:hypothetical protein
MMLASETCVHQTLVSVSRSVTRVSDGGAVPTVPARVYTSSEQAADFVEHLRQARMARYPGPRSASPGADCQHENRNVSRGGRDV